MKKYIVIPSYKPDEKLIELAKSLNERKCFVVIVDDGSGEEYKEVFDRVREFADVVSYPINMGKGYALKEGFKYIKKIVTGEGTVITCDSDGQHSVKDIIRVSEIVESEVLALGVRAFNKDDVPLRSKLGNKITSKIFWLSTGENIVDTQTGLRGFSTDLLDEMILIEGNRYEYEMNMLSYIAKSEYKIKTISIDTIYENNNEGSHFRTIRDSALIYGDILKFSLSSFISFLVDFFLFSLMIISGFSLTISNIFARLISSYTNYTLNRRYVFSSEKNLESAVKYILLAMGILIANTSVVIFLSELIGINKIVSKFFTETIFFLISWSVQNNLVFNSKARFSKIDLKEKFRKIKYILTRY